MRYVTATFAIGAMMFGIFGAQWWHKSTLAKIFPDWESDGPMEPVEPAVADREMIVTLYRGLYEAAECNKVAAQFTAASVICAGIASFLSLL